MTIRELIQAMAREGLQIHCKVCTVDAVDEQARTVDCTPIDESAPLPGVNLQANQGSKEGVVMIPAVESYVVVAFLSGATAVVVLCDKIDKMLFKTGNITVEIAEQGIVLNDGALGGLVKVESMVGWMQKVYSDLQTLQSLLAIAPVAGNGAPLGAVFTPSTPAPVAGNFENEKVKH